MPNISPIRFETTEPSAFEACRLSKKKKKEKQEKLKGKRSVYSYLWKSISQLRSVTCRMGSHSVTSHSTQANTPRLYPSQRGWYSIYRPFKDGGLSKPWPRPRVHYLATHLSASDSFATMALYKFIYLLTYLQRATGPRLLRDSPGQRDPNPRPSDRKSSTLTTRLYRATQETREVAI